MAKWTTAQIPFQGGKLAVVTGANSGIGWHTALELARAGAEVIITVRSEAKGRNAMDRIRSEVPQAKLRAEILDLASLSSVRDFATRVSAEAKLDLLVNNAGVMRIPQRRLTEDGFEMQFGVNYLGPFALTALLIPALQRAPLPRVTAVSSGAANLGLRRINFEDLQWQRSYGPWNAYCQSKLAGLMFMLELGRRCNAARSKLVSTGAHPGFARTNLQTSGPGREQNFAQKMATVVLSQDAVHGALPTLRAATEPGAVNGEYFGPDGLFELKGDPVPVPIPKPAQDEAAAQRLWDVSQELTAVSFSSL